MDPVVQMLVVALATFLASSSGFWVYLKRRIDQQNANTQLLLGLAHDKITHFGMKYIEKGFVTKDEYDDLIRYFYEPYIELGGDGTAERIMRLVQRLPLTLESSRIAQIADDARIRAEDNLRRERNLERADELFKRKMDEEERAEAKKKEGTEDEC